MFVLELIRRLNEREEGATAAEYGVMVAAILAVIVATVFLIGQEIHQAFLDVYNQL